MDDRDGTSGHDLAAENDWLDRLRFGIDRGIASVRQRIERIDYASSDRRSGS